MEWYYSARQECDRLVLTKEIKDESPHILIALEVIIAADLFADFFFNETDSVIVSNFDELKQLAKVFWVGLAQNILWIRLLLQPMDQETELESIHVLKKDPVLIPCTSSLLLHYIVSFVF